jgi:hypothetical protein
MKTPPTNNAALGQGVLDSFRMVVQTRGALAPAVP